MDPTAQLQKKFPPWREFFHQYRGTKGWGGAAAGSAHHPEVLGLLYGVMHSMLVLVLHAARVLCCQAAGVTDGAQPSASCQGGACRCRCSRSASVGGTQYKIAAATKTSAHAPGPVRV
eukprot:COSAG01_NODE_3402_length_6135_cov_21.923956_9_plen_118_part_00